MFVYFNHTLLRASLHTVLLISFLSFGLFALVEADPLEEPNCEAKMAKKHGLDNCPYSIDWEPSEQQIEGILMEHEKWLDNEEDSDKRGHAVLCNAYLRDIHLEGVDLRRADLRGVSFHETKLEGAKFHKAVLQGAKFRGAMLKNAKFRGADLRSAEFRHGLHRGDPFDIDISDVDFRESDLRGADFEGAILTGSDFRAANLQNVEFRDVILQHADFKKNDLREVTFKDVDLSGAYFQRACLQEIELKDENLQGAKLRNAYLQDAHLDDANLQGADLQQADLRGAELKGTDISEALLTGADLGGARYEPISVPDMDYLAGIRGIESVTFKNGNQSSLAQLRDLFRKVGHRELERQTTFVIRQNEAYRLRKSEYLDDRIEGVAQLILFEWTVAWGLHPGRSLYIILLLMFVSSVFYTVMIVTAGRRNMAQHGIFRVWPQGRLETGKDGVILAEADKVDLLVVSTRTAWLWGLYFSLLSSFHIGWRDLNVGTWLARLQFTEFGLRGLGLVRFWSGIQSIISVFLLAMWFLSYFGRPFQ